MYRLTQKIGFIMILVAILAAIAALITDYTLFDRQDMLSLLAMQAIIGGFLMYGAAHKIKGSKIGEKLYPSSIAATILFVAFAYRWYWYG